MYLNKDKVIRHFIQLYDEDLKLQGNKFDFLGATRHESKVTEEQKEEIDFLKENITTFVKTLNQIDLQLLYELKHNDFINDLLVERDNVISGIYKTSTSVKNVLSVARARHENKVRQAIRDGKAPKLRDFFKGITKQERKDVDLCDVYIFTRISREYCELSTTQHNFHVIRRLGFRKDPLHSYMGNWEYKYSTYNRRRRLDIADDKVRIMWKVDLK